VEGAGVAGLGLGSHGRRAAASGAPTCSWVTVRGPMTESTARWATALPVPKARPGREKGRGRRVRVTTAWRGCDETTGGGSTSRRRHKALDQSAVPPADNAILDRPQSSSWPAGNRAATTWLEHVTPVTHLAQPCRACRRPCRRHHQCAAREGAAAAASQQRHTERDGNHWLDQSGSGAWP